MKNIEQEFKWDASPRGAFERFVSALKETESKISRAEKVTIADYYLEDAAGQLAARKIALRIRHIGAKWEVTYKSRSQIQNGLAVREEKTLALPVVRSVKSALRALARRGEWNGVKLTDLSVRFVIRNRRELYQVCYQNCQCEAALDNYVTQACGHRLRRKEIELELKKGHARDFAQLVKKISVSSGLCAAKISKVAGAEKWISQKISFN